MGPAESCGRQTKENLGGHGGDFGFYSMRDGIHWRVLNKGMTDSGLNRIILAADDRKVSKSKSQAKGSSDPAESRWWFRGSVFAVEVGRSGWILHES